MSLLHNIRIISLYIEKSSSEESLPFLQKHDAVKNTLKKPQQYACPTAEDFY